MNGDNLDGHAVTGTKAASTRMAGKTLTLNEIRRRCAQMAVSWRDEPGEERQQGQLFIRDLLQAFGITDTKAALYEKRTRRTSTARIGFVDALVPGLCLIEMKTAGKDLEAAEGQALDYIDSLSDIEAPRWVITSDFKNIRVLSMHAADGHDVETFTLDQLPAHAEALAFLAGYQTRTFGDQEQEAASIKAARIMAALYESLGDSGYSDHEASVFLVRVLFALYADDAGVWERDLFYEFLERRTSDDGSDLGPQLTMLFQVLNRTPEQRQKNLDELLARFPYVNGGIFAEPAPIPSFDHDMRQQLLDACAFNWSAISPAIFGSLFQSVKSAEARRELGEHYTTETNILKTIEPLFLDGLRAEFAAAVHDVKRLRRLRRDIGKLRVMDPACGCGNFLVVAYRELRALDLQILQRLQALGDRGQGIHSAFFTKDQLPVTLDHFFGIELEEWPARIATTALHLVDHQANQAMELALGQAPDPLPLDKIEPIHVGNALRKSWSEILPPSDDVVLVGNPPFVGHKRKTPSQVADLKLVWGNGYDGYLDYVTCWYRLAADYFRHIKEGRFAFVSTNSVAQGQPVPALFRPLLSEGWRIKFAHQTFAWSSEAPEAAAVHCVIIGFDKHQRPRPTLYTYAHPKADPVAVTVDNINPYLLDAPNVFVTKRTKLLSEGLPTVSFGTMPVDGGNLLLDEAAHDAAMADPVAAKYVRRFVGAHELIHNEDRWCLWMEDLDPADLRRSSFLRSRVESCRVWRSRTTDDKGKSLLGGDAYKYRDTPHLMRPNKSRPLVPYVCIPRHFSETRRYATVARFGPEVICGDSNFTAEDPDGLLFALISSSMFLAWQRAIGGTLESRLRFSATIVWNNLPLPDLSDRNRAAIISAGTGVLNARAAHPDRSLADLYNPLAMDPTLIRAHDALDRAVDKSFAPRSKLTTDAERQTVLFRRYAELTAGEQPRLPSARRQRV